MNRTCGIQLYRTNHLARPWERAKWALLTQGRPSIPADHPDGPSSHVRILIDVAVLTPVFFPTSPFAGF
jgi:hypothetical protein